MMMMMMKGNCLNLLLAVLCNRRIHSTIADHLGFSWFVPTMICDKRGFYTIYIRYNLSLGSRIRTNPFIKCNVNKWKLCCYSLSEFHCEVWIHAAGEFLMALDLLLARLFWLQEIHGRKTPMCSFWNLGNQKSVDSSSPIYNAKFFISSWRCASLNQSHLLGYCSRTINGIRQSVQDEAGADRRQECGASRKLSRQQSLMTLNCR